jgi:hypothetical protein
VFVLARYYREYEGKEFIIKPQYLDTLHANRINSETTERLTLHIKVINLKKQRFALHWEISEPGGREAEGLLYAGQLSRKDFLMALPLFAAGDHEYSFRLSSEDSDDLFSLPLMRYKVKGGVKAQLDHK